MKNSERDHANDELSLAEDCGECLSGSKGKAQKKTAMPEGKAVKLQRIRSKWELLGEKRDLAC